MKHTIETLTFEVDRRRTVVKMREGEGIRVGSERHSDLRLEGPSVNRMHAVIEDVDGVPTLMELRPGGRHGVKLVVGETFSVGRMNVRLVAVSTKAVEEAAPEPPPAPPAPPAPPPTPPVAVVEPEATITRETKHYNRYQSGRSTPGIARIMNEQRIEELRNTIGAVFYEAPDEVDPHLSLGAWREVFEYIDVLEARLAEAVARELAQTQEPKP